MGFIKNVTATYVFEYKWRFFVQYFAYIIKI